MNSVNLLLSTYKKKKKWLTILPFLLILSAGTYLVQWRYKHLKRLQQHSQVLKNTPICKKIHTIHRQYSFILELVQILAPLLGNHLRFESLESEHAMSVILRGQAAKPEHVFEFMEVLESQSWLNKITLESLHNADDNLVSFCIHLSKSDTLVE